MKRAQDMANMERSDYAQDVFAAISGNMGKKGHQLFVAHVKGLSGT